MREHTHPEANRLPSCSFILLLNNFINLAMLGLCRCTGFSLVVVNGGLLSSGMQASHCDEKLLMASAVAEHRL